MNSAIDAGSWPGTADDWYILVYHPSENKLLRIFVNGTV